MAKLITPKGSLSQDIYTKRSLDSGIHIPSLDFKWKYEDKFVGGIDDEFNFFMVGR